MDYMADYNEAQASGLHHVDCDGWMTDHRVEIVCNEHGTFEAVCADCGKLGVGSFGQKIDCVRFHAGHSEEVKCDGRCKLWNEAA